MVADRDRRSPQEKIDARHKKMGDLLKKLLINKTKKKKK